MAHLTTVPTFNFNQLDEDGCAIEGPIQVSYYNGSIEIKMVDETCSAVVVHPDNVKALFKEIMKHMPEAQHYLTKR